MAITYCFFFVCIVKENIFVDIDLIVNQRLLYNSNMLSINLIHLQVLQD